MNSSYPVSVSDLDISEVGSLLKNVIKTDIVPFLWGPPGIGKSTIVKELAKAEKYELIDLRLSLLSPVDLRGLPVVDKDNKQASWYPPSFFPKFNTKTKGILFLDEINFQGGGGTDFEPVFEEITKREIKPKGVFYFTDLMGSFPRVEPNYPVFWLVRSGVGENYGFQAPFGKVINFLRK